jgi:hypothetical protein
MQRMLSDAAADEDDLEQLVRIAHTGMRYRATPERKKAQSAHDHSVFELFLINFTRALSPCVAHETSVLFGLCLFRLE